MSGGDQRDLLLNGHARAQAWNKGGRGRSGISGSCGTSRRCWCASNVWDWYGGCRRHRLGCGRVAIGRRTRKPVLFDGIDPPLIQRNANLGAMHENEQPMSHTGSDRVAIPQEDVQQCLPCHQSPFAVRTVTAGGLIPVRADISRVSDDRGPPMAARAFLRVDAGFNPVLTFHATRNRPPRRMHARTL